MLPNLANRDEGDRYWYAGTMVESGEARQWCRSGLVSRRKVLFEVHF